MTQKRGLKRSQVAVGTKVRCTRAVDRACDPEAVGRLGTVIGFIVGDCGATGRDPMVLVRYLVKGDPKPRRDGFWLEELALAKARPRHAHVVSCRFSGVETCRCSAWRPVRVKRWRTSTPPFRRDRPLPRRPSRRPRRTPSR